MIRRILVPLDGSGKAERILPGTLQLARAFGARIDLLHVISAQGLQCGRAPPDPVVSRMARVDRVRYLDRMAEGLRAEGATVFCHVEVGGPAAVIVDFLRRGEHDLVALTPHGTGDDRLLDIGCTALAVLVNARSGVFLHPGVEASPTAPADPDAGRVLLPVDCSPRSDWAVGFAAMLASGTGSTLDLVHVLTDPRPVGRYAEAAPAAELRARLRVLNHREAGRWLEEASERLRPTGVPVRTRLVEGDTIPADSLLDLVQTERPAFVVLCAHGSGGRSRWPFGGTAARVLFQARRPVLLLQDLPVERMAPPRVSRTARALAGDS